MWNWLLVLFAGSYAQAFETRRSLTRTVLHSGKLDMEAGAPAVAWLVRRGYARTRMEALRRIHGGYGSGSKCDACDQPIERNQVEYEVEDAERGKTLRLHLGCHVLWQVECVQRIRASSDTP